MTQIKIFKRFWNPKIVRSQPECLFIFGDNDIQKGKRGQAIIRDEPNAIGIPTRVSIFEGICLLY